jgi:hypothetical protein
MNNNLRNIYKQNSTTSVTVPVPSFNPAHIHEGPIAERGMQFFEKIPEERKHIEKPYIGNKSLMITISDLTNILDKYILELESRIKLPKKTFFGKLTGKINDKNSESIKNIIDNLKNTLDEENIEDFLNKFGSTFIEAKNDMKKMGSNNSYFKRMTRSKSWRKYPRIAKMFELVRLPSIKNGSTIIPSVTIYNEKKQEIVPSITILMTEAYNYINEGNMYNYSNWYGGKRSRPKARRTYKSKK